MRKYEHIIIGFGKGGKTLAGALGKAGKKTALIEQSEKMYGGTCINVACIPSKYLEHQAELSVRQMGSFEEKAAFYRDTVLRKRALVEKLRGKNYNKLAGNEQVDVITAKASFLDAHHIQLQYADGQEEVIEGEKFYLNTGAVPFLPPIKGAAESRRFYTSETLMEEEKLPRHLVIIGSGYIGVEFASYYINFGSKVTIIQKDGTFFPREDREIAKKVLESLLERGVRVLEHTGIESIKDAGDETLVLVNTPDGQEILRADAVLAATGRRPNTAGLGLEKAGVEKNSQGAVKTDDSLKTTADHIWAMGDVAGGLQFTYISLDDYRIMKSQVLGDGERTTANRGAVPYSVFTMPPFSRVGLSEEEARQQGYEIEVKRLLAQAIPKAQVLEEPTGMLKAVIDKKTSRILGAHFFCAESQEMINTVKVVIDAGLPYTVLRDGIFTHPTMSEAMNDLFA